MAAAASGAGGMQVARPDHTKMTAQQIGQRYKNLLQFGRAIMSRMADVQGQIAEHQRVVEKLRSIPTERRCYRLVDRVLVEKTVGEVLPDVELNLSNFQEALSQMQARRDSVEEERAELQKTYGIQMRRAGDGQRGGVPV